MADQLWAVGVKRRKKATTHSGLMLSSMADKFFLVQAATAKRRRRHRTSCKNTCPHLQIRNTSGVSGTLHLPNTCRSRSP